MQGKHSSSPDKVKQVPQSKKKGGGWSPLLLSPSPHFFPRWAAYLAPHSDGRRRRRTGGQKNLPLGAERGSSSKDKGASSPLHPDQYWCTGFDIRLGSHWRNRAFPPPLPQIYLNIRGKPQICREKKGRGGEHDPDLIRILPGH